MKKINFGILFVLFCTFWACADEKQAKNSKRNSFRLPVIVNTPPAVDAIADDYGLVNFDYLGTYGFADSINLDNQALLLKRDREYNPPNPVYALVEQNDIPRFGRIDSNLLTDLKIVVDDRKAFSYAMFQLKNTSDNFLMLYVVNETKQKKAFYAGGDNLCTTLEAENERKEWQTVTSNGCPWCGNSYHWVRLPAKNFAAFRIPQWQGDFKTRLRIKFSNGGQVYYSQSYEGSIDKKMLKNKIW